MYMRIPILNDVDYKRVKRYSKPEEPKSFLQTIIDYFFPVRREIVYVKERIVEKEPNAKEYVKSRRLK